MKFLAILTAVPFESELLLTKLKNIRQVQIAGKTLYKGKLAKRDIILMNTGIGKVNAAHSVTVILENYSIECAINSGIGGAYPDSGLKIGDIAIASKEIYGDDGVISSKGWKGMKEIGIPLSQSGQKEYFNEFPLNKSLAGKFLRIIRSKTGNFITLSATTGTHQRALELEKRFKAVCENMEGAAIAHVCTIYKVPLIEIRGISNIVGIRDKRRWNLNLASENCQNAVMEIIRQL